MKAIQINETGGASVLRLANLPQVKPAPGEVLVRIKAAGLNFIDIYMRTGRYPTTLPYVPGYEASGAIEAIGEGVTEFKTGDRVAYATTLGSYAEYNLVPAAQLIHLPTEMSFAEGAAFPLQGITAQYLLHEFYAVKPNDTVLVHAAAGGVGLLLVQWLKHKGAYVVGTVSTQEKAALVKAAGADHVILYTEHDFVEEIKKLTHGRGADFIIDGVGNTTFTKNLEAVRTRGHICIYGAASGPAAPLMPNALQAKSITVSGGSIFNFINTQAEILKRAHTVMEGIKQGWLKLKIDYVFPLEKAGEAQQMLEGRKTYGKVILTVD